jgi:ATP-dependent helicase HrpB
MPRFDPPEIMEADLSALVLASAIWGVADPRDLAWIDPPSEAAVSEARVRLAALDAIDGDGRPTAHGRAIAALPMPPRLAHMLVRAGQIGLAGIAAEVAVLLGERGLGGSDADLELRLRRWRADRSPKAQAARKLAERWSRAIPLPPAEGVRGGTIPGHGASSKTALPTLPKVPHESSSFMEAPRGLGVEVAVALAFPDRIARRRDASGERWASVGGRGFKLDPTSTLAREEWLAVAETQGMAAGARILSAAAIDEETVAALFGDRIETRRLAEFDPATGSVRPIRERRLGAIRLSSGPDSSADAAVVEAALVEGVRAHGLALLPWGEGAVAFRQRAVFAGLPFDDEALVARLDEWLPALVAGRRRLDAISPGALVDGLRNLLSWDDLQRIERVAPSHFGSPAGSAHAIDYAAEGGPRVELRVQALFGLAEHPTVGADRVPLLLSLTSPAGRPIQTTRDLPGFWAGSWAAVAKEMRGRYPRHPWPDDPASAAATLRTKNADARARGSR